MSFPKRHAISRARFFLELAEGCTVDERDAFEAYLEAAIIFGRTAIHRLIPLYENHPGWKAWFDSLWGDSSIEFFKEYRDDILHERPAKFGQIIAPPTITPPGQPDYFEDDRVTRAADLYYISDYGGDPTTPATDTVKYHLEVIMGYVETAENKFGS
jgi:hypothetical protein